MKYRFIFIVLGFILWMGCYDETSLIPTEKPEMKYELPQGNHDYDQRIVDWFNRCGFYILYKFEPKDVYWNLDVWEGGTWDSIQKKYVNSMGALSFYVIEPAEEAYVDALLRVVENKFLTFYPDSILHRCMPMKLCLCSEVWDVSWGKSKNNLYGGFDNISINNASADLDAMTSLELESFQDAIHELFLSRAIKRDKIIIPPAFKNVSMYDGSFMYMMDVRYKKGFLSGVSYATYENDWPVYINAIVETPYSVLTAEPVSATDGSFKGILHPRKDVNGLILKKYNIIINYFKQNYGMDLQKIGDAHAVI